MHTKLIIFGAILIIAVVLGFWFWGEFIYNQDELSNPPLEQSLNQAPSSPASASNDSASIESELDAINLDELDAEAAEMDLSGL